MRNRDIKNKSNFNSIPRDGNKYKLISNWKKLYAKKPKFAASVPAAAAAIVASFGQTLPVFALPEGLTVKQGNLTTQTSDNTLTINQGSSRAFGDWNSFDIQSNETVNINQPNEKNNSTLSVEDLKELGNTRLPKSKRKQKSDKNTISLDI